MFTGSLTIIQGCSPLNIIHRCSLTVCSVDSQKRTAAAFQLTHASTTPMKYIPYESTHNSDYATNQSKLISSTIVDVRLALCLGETTQPQKTQITFFHHHFFTLNNSTISLPVCCMQKADHVPRNLGKEFGAGVGRVGAVIINTDPINDR